MYQRLRAVVRTLERANRGLVLGASYVAAAIIAVMAVTVGVEVIRRSSGFGSVPGLLEFNETLLVCVVFLAMAHAERMETHVRVQLLTSRLSLRNAATLRVVGMAMSLVMCVLFAYYATDSAIQSYVTKEARYGLLHFPLWPARFAVMLGFWLVAVQYLVKIAHNLDSIRTGRDSRRQQEQRMDLQSGRPEAGGYVGM